MSHELAEASIEQPRRAGLHSAGPVAIASVLALVVGITVGQMLPERAEPTTLDNFDSLPVAPPNELLDALSESQFTSDVEVRFLGEVAGFEMFGAVGEAAGTSDALSGEIVCFYAAGVVPGSEQPSGGGACQPREEFLRSGISMNSGGFTFEWGPYGPPTLIPCDAESWLQSCPGPLD